MDEVNREDQLILEALERATTPEIPSAPLEDPVEDLRVREFTEVLGLLAYDLEPRTPNLGTKVRILAAISGAEDRPAPALPGAALGSTDRSFDELTFRGPATPAPEHFERPEPAELTLRHGAEESPVPSVVPFPTAPPPQRSGWTSWALAAMLGICMLGLGFFAGRVREQAEIITDLQQKAQAIPGQVSEIETLRDELRTVQQRFDMVTRVARSSYAMEKMGEEGESQDVGRIYVCGAHQRWYLNLRDLESPPPGKEYYLWFMTAEGPVSGGVLEVTDDATAEMDDFSMPQGTSGFTVTLEDAGSHLEAPAGAIVLLGEERASL